MCFFFFCSLDACDAGLGLMFRLPDGCDIPSPCYGIFAYSGPEKAIATTHDDLLGCCLRRHDAVVLFAFFFSPVSSG